MMRKRTNRCRNTVWDISVISRNKNGETLCGDQCALEWDDNDATVILSDGLGSGVKANILSTLTTTMLTTMLKGNVPIDECVTTVAETLPMCRERKLAYATFTILQTAGTRARLIQYDNPNAVFVHNGAIGKYNYSVNFIQEKELHESYLHFDVGDMLVLFSDGVSEAGRGVTTDAGWARQDIEDFILVLHFFLIGIGFHADVSKSVNRWPNPYSGFHASANLNRFPHFQEILLLEQFLDNRLDLSSGELLINRCQVRNQLVRVMPDLVKLIAIFIIARMGGFHLPNLLIQFFFQFQIIFFRTFHVGILAGICRPHKGTACSLNCCTTA